MLVEGREFQGDAGPGWLRWAEVPGRCLVVVPPFGRAETAHPVPWTATKAPGLAGGETDLGRLLARERRHALSGQMVPVERTAGDVVTMSWRKHPAAGRLVVTAHPLWSLTVAGQPGAAREWLSAHLAEAGQPPSEDSSDTGDSAPLREPTEDEWALAVHLCTAAFESSDEALLALRRSTVQQLNPDRAREALTGLHALGLARAGTLTPVGEAALLRSPFAPYARAFWRARGHSPA